MQFMPESHAMSIGSFIEPQSGHQQPGYEGRESFEVRLKWQLNLRRYRVFTMRHGLLLVDLGKVVKSGEVVGAAVGVILAGAVGAAVGKAIGSSMQGEDPWKDLNWRSDDQLIAMARQRKHSIVVTYEEIESVSIEVPGMLTQMTKSSLVGLVRLKDSTLGKLKIELHDVISMSTAIDALPRALGGKVSVNAEFDSEDCVFVRKRS